MVENVGGSRWNRITIICRSNVISTSGLWAAMLKFGSPRRRPMPAVPNTLIQWFVCIQIHKLHVIHPRSRFFMHFSCYPGQEKLRFRSRGM